MPAFVVPALFVLLWSTGFLGARMGSPDAEPFHFLAWRFGLVVVLLLPAALLGKAVWPERSRIGWMALAGALTHGACLGGVFNAIQAGMPLGLVALIGSLQPVLTALIATTLLGESLRPIQWLGVLLGLAGVALVASGKLGAGRITAFGLACCGVATLGITIGTLVQKRFGGGSDFRTVGVIQYTAAFAAMLLGALCFEAGPVRWTPNFIGALAWLVVVNSLCAVALLYVLVARSSIAGVTSLFYLTPSVTAVLALLVFREPITLWMAAGIAVSSVGVFLTIQPAPAPPPAG